MLAVESAARERDTMRSIALVLTTLTGFTGLVYEVLWQRYLATLLGSHGEATAAVLAIFLGGLACGYALFGSLARRLVRSAAASAAAPRLLFSYGIVEAGIGIYAFAFPLLFLAARRVSLANPIGFEGAAFAFDVALTILLIGPPTVLMGGTIPLLTQGLVAGIADATRLHALVYATNTLGAFLGAVAGGFVLLPRLGLTNAMVSMGAINLAAGIVFVVLGSPRSAPVPTTPPQSHAERESLGLGPYLIAALLAGFAMMVLQTTFNRIGAMSLGASEFTFATVVAAYVLCMAIGSVTVSFARRIPRATPVVVSWMLVAYLIVLYPNVEDAPYWAHLLRTLFAEHSSGFYPYYLTILGAILAILLVPLALSGAMLPLLFHHLRREFDDLGSIAGRLYGWNTVGSLLGALTGGYLLLFWLDLHHVYRLAVIALVACAGVLSLAVLERGLLVALLASVPALMAITLWPPWSTDRLSSGLLRFRTPLAASHLGPDRFFDDYFQGPQATHAVFYDDDPCTSVAAVASRTTTNEGDLSIFVNGKSDGSVYGDDITTRMLALIPTVLSENTARAFIIGYGTGVTAGELAEQPGVKEITVAEISAGVIGAAPLFEKFNGRVLENPKVRLVRGDAYRVLLREHGKFDIIISEPSNPRVTGVEMLYAEEFLQAARLRLSDGGVYAQWFHTSAMDATSLALVLNTFRQVFPRASLWFTAKQDLVLVGFGNEERSDDLDRIRKRWSSDQLRSRFARHGIDSLPALLAHELLPAGVLEAAELPATVHTLLRPVLSHAAGRADFTGLEAPLPSTSSPAAAEMGANNSLLGRYRSQVSDEEWKRTRQSMVTQGCYRSASVCVTFLAHWYHDEPDSPAFRRLFRQARDFWGEDISDDLLVRVAGLWNTTGTKRPSAEQADAEQAAANFATFYSHALPFDAATVRAP